MGRFKALLEALMNRLEEADVFGLSAQLAYFFLLSLFPFLIFIMNLIGLLPLDHDILVTIIGYYAPEEITDLITTNMDQLIHANSRGLLSLGAIGTLWAASNAINAIMRAFNKIYQIEETRHFLFNRFIAVVLTIAMIFVIIIALLLPVFGRIIGVHIFAFFGLSERFLEVWEMLRWLLSTIIFFIVLLALYKLAPSKWIRIRDAVWGAIIATGLWQIVSYGFSFYVNSLANYSANYGSLGTIIILMIWFYLFGLIIMLGGAFNAFLSQIKGGKRK
ncbi:hypothetical protein GCM10010978_25760 [Compostibacillus humi]|uniref:Uncharacterized protein n=1 Tax=Compostibacillus humi TaxID=1245525 RepID=A0A8J2TRP6_9BACI|nr:YihY/virulence factor BrkB family protein [Compostibacillus humi]GFZ84284.1 hypothetical protein GCM10010978_25760 [Compostibacillus humi]HLT54769.1 YihY/virulence factor BrkB family protein [Bacillota bacterium]